MATCLKWFRRPVIIGNDFATTKQSVFMRSDVLWAKKGGRYTKSSRGRVVKQLNPKQNLARLTMPFSLGKLFRIFPIVLSLNTRTPARAMIRHATRLNPVLK